MHRRVQARTPLPTVAVALWQRLSDSGHVQAVGAYFHHVGGFEATEWFEPKTPGADPLYIVQARTPLGNEATERTASYEQPTTIQTSPFGSV